MRSKQLYLITYKRRRKFGSLCDILQEGVHGYWDCVTLYDLNLDDRDERDPYSLFRVQIIST